MNATPTPRNWKPPLVVLVGMGMGPEDLGDRARAWISSAEVLAGGERHLEGFPDHRGLRVLFKGPLQPRLDEIRDISREKRTAVLASGDPFFFGIGRRLTECLGKENVLALPNVTSLQAFFSRLKEPWEGVETWSLHGRGAGADPSAWLSRLARPGVLAFFTDPEHSPAWMASEMLNAGCRDWKMAVGEDLGLPTERVRWYALEEAARREFSPLNMVALFPAWREPAATLGERETAGSQDERFGGPSAAPVCASRLPECDFRFSQPFLGLPEAAFQHEAGLITKMEVRVVSLAHLQLLPGQILWDVGAGSGSVGIEAARMVPSARIFAMEREARRVEDIRENVRRFRCFGIRTLCGPAPEIFTGLPDPHRVFIGGSGGHLPEILKAVAERLRPGGRVVQTMVRLDNLEASRSFWESRGFGVELSQIQVSRGTPVGKGLRLEALNPVFILVVSEK